MAYFQLKLHLLYFCLYPFNITKLCLLHSSCQFFLLVFQVNSIFLVKSLQLNIFFSEAFHYYRPVLSVFFKQWSSIIKYIWLVLWHSCRYMLWVVFETLRFQFNYSGFPFWLILIYILKSTSTSLVPFLFPVYSRK